MALASSCFRKANVDVYGRQIDPLVFLERSDRRQHPAVGSVQSTEPANGTHGAAHHGPIARGRGNGHQHDAPFEYHLLGKSTPSQLAPAVGAHFIHTQRPGDCRTYGRPMISRFFRRFYSRKIHTGGPRFGRPCDGRRRADLLPAGHLPTDHGTHAEIQSRKGQLNWAPTACTLAEPIGGFATARPSIQFLCYSTGGIVSGYRLQYLPMLFERDL